MAGNRCRPPTRRQPDLHPPPPPLDLRRLLPADLRADPGARPLLLLHGLGDRSPVAVPDDVAAWPGPIAALDFTGHGDSTTIGAERAGVLERAAELGL